MKSLLISVLVIALLTIFYLQSQSPTQQAELPVQAMEKAKGLEQLTRQQAEDQLKQLDAQMNPVDQPPAEQAAGQ